MYTYDCRAYDGAAIWPFVSIGGVGLVKAGMPWRSYHSRSGPKGPNCRLVSRCFAPSAMSHAGWTTKCSIPS